MNAILSRCARVVACVVLLAVSTAAAFAVSVNTNYIPGTDFSRFHTYRWVAIEDAPYVDPITDKQIKQAIDAQLSAKGWKRTEDASAADALVAYQVNIEREYRTSYYGGYGYGWGWGGAPVSSHTSTTDRGTLTLDFYNAKAKEMLWRGQATDSLRKKATPEKRQQRIDKAMAKLLRNFPPSE